MYSIRETIKNKRGFTLVEVIVTLSLITLTLALLVPTLSVHLATYNDFSDYTKNTIAIKEALAQIDDEISKKGGILSITGSGLEIQKRSKSDSFDNKRKVKIETTSKVVKSGSTLYIHFMGASIQPQPLLYDVEEFNMEENAGVIFIEIKTKDGSVYEKAFDKGL